MNPKVVMLSVTAGSNDVRIMKEAQHLVKLGVSVTVVGKKVEGYSNQEIIDGVKIVRAPTIISLSNFLNKSLVCNSKNVKVETIEAVFCSTLKLILNLNKLLRNKKPNQFGPEIKHNDNYVIGVHTKENKINEYQTTGSTSTLNSTQAINKITKQKDETTSPILKSKQLGIIYWNILRPFLYPKYKKIKKLIRRDKVNLLRKYKTFWMRRFKSYILFMSSYFVTSKELFDKIIVEQPDIIHAHDLYTLPAAVKASQCCGAKVVYDAHEYERYRKPDMDWLHQTWVKWLEKVYVKKADGYITVSHSIAKAMKNNLNISEPMVVFNSPPMLNYTSSLKKLDIKSKLGLDKHIPLAVNVGKYYDIFNHDQKIYLLITALQFAPKFHLAILGFKALGIEDSIYEYAKEKNVLDRVHCIDSVPYDEISPFISTADVGVYSIPLVSKNADFSMPNKLFEKTLAGLPIAIAETTDAKKYLDETKTGILMDAWDPKSIADAMVYLQTHKNEFKKPHHELEAMHRLYGWEAQVVKIIELYSSLGIELPKTEYRHKIDQFLESTI